MVWTQFYDMHSGGKQKLDHWSIFIEAPKEEAEIIFGNRFKRNPHNVTCSCCGQDYSVDEYETLFRAVRYHLVKTRGVSDDELLKQFIEKQKNNICIIFEKDIKPEERTGELPECEYYDYYDDSYYYNE